MNWLLGLKALGCQVLFIDSLTTEICAGEIQGSWQARYLAAVMERFSLERNWTLLDVSDGRAVAGISRSEMVRRAQGADFLLNFNGYLADRQILELARQRVYVDIDPGFGQMWCQLGLHEPFSGHDQFVTIAENIGKPICAIPSCGLDWITTRQPVMMELWPAKSDGHDRPFTSIGAWRGPAGPVEYEGKTYGLRAHEFRKFAQLPGMTAQKFDLALDIDDGDANDLDLLRGSGWNLISPGKVAGDPDSYRRFVQASKAEFMVAKNLYVETRGGWFSDRSACYLASARPVLAEDTGVRDLYPTGAGLVVFSSLDEAIAGVETISADYDRHTRAARELAESEFESGRVLTRLLEQLAA